MNRRDQAIHDRLTALTIDTVEAIVRRQIEAWDGVGELEPVIVRVDMGPFTYTFGPTRITGAAADGRR